MPQSHYNHWLSLAGALLGALLLCGCGARPGTSAGESPKKTYYFDAELQFAIKIPSEWHLSRGEGQEPESCTVRWYAATDAEEGESVAQATVVACPIEHWPAEAETMRAEQLAALPGLTLEPREDLAPASGGGESLEGRDATRRYLITLLPTEERGYIVTLSAPLGAFEKNRPLLEEMLASFEPVTGY